jgi:hypothetical protein
MSSVAARGARIALMLGLSALPAACGEDRATEVESPPPRPEVALPKEGRSALRPLIGRWAVRAEGCAVAETETGAVIEVTEDGFTSGSAACRFGEVARNGPRYEIVGNCGTESSGPTPDETLIFVFTGLDRLEWRSEEGSVQFEYLRCPE